MLFPFSFMQSQSTINPDAQAFITAAGITNPTEISAINTLVNDLQGYGLWTKMKAIYPFVGGTSTTCKYNLKDPRDLDAAFRLVFNGGWTFASTGATPNGTNGYGDTKLNVLSNILLNSVHLSYYSRTSTTGLQSEIGSYTSSPDVGTFLAYNYAGGNYKGLNANSTNVGSAFTPSTGFLLASRINSTTEKYYFKGTLTDTLSKNSVALNNQNIYIGAHNVNNAPSNYSAKQTAFASIGDGLTDTEASNLYSSVQTFNTTLSRQV